MITNYTRFITTRSVVYYLSYVAEGSSPLISYSLLVLVVRIWGQYLLTRYILIL